MNPPKLPSPSPSENLQTLTLGAEEVAWFLGSRNLDPSSLSPFSTIIPAAPAADPTAAESSLLGEVLTALATPTSLLVTRTTLAAGSAHASYYRFGSQGRPRFASCTSVEGNSFRLTYPWDAAMLTAHFAGVLEAPTCGSSPPLDIELSAPGLRILGAAVDACREILCASMSAREAVSGISLTLEGLRPHHQLDGSESDPRWLGTLLPQLGPEFGPLPTEACRPLLQDLVQAGFFEAGREGAWQATPTLLQTAVDLLVPLPALCIQHRGVETGSEHALLLLRGRGLWGVSSAGSGSGCRFRSLSGPAALEETLRVLGAIHPPEVSTPPGPDPVPPPRPRAGSQPPPD
jgi:hypothetical protein